MNKTRILHVVNVPFVIPYFLGDQITYFANNGYEIHIACSNDKNISNYIKIWDFKYLPLKITRDFSLLIDLISLVKLIFYIKKNKIDIVVGHTPKGALLATLSAFLCKSKKRFYFRHGLMYETSFGFKKKILILIEKITSFLSTDVICVSNSVLKKSIEFNLSDFQKLRIINYGTCNGVDSKNKFNKRNININNLSALRSNLKINEYTFVIGYVGRISKDKGIEILIEAWTKLLESKKIRDIKLVICGPLDSRDPISKKTLDIINNEPTIIHVGEISNTQYYYSIFNVLILPSYREGFPTVVLEASSMEVPIITTKSTGCIDSIIENETGVFTDINSADIYNKIINYYNNPYLLHEHGINGRKFIEKYFSQDVFFEYLLKNIYS